MTGPLFSENGAKIICTRLSGKEQAMRDQAGTTQVDRGAAAQEMNCKLDRAV